MFTRQHRAAVSLVVALSTASVLLPGPAGESPAWAQAAPADGTAEAKAKQAYARGAELYKERKFSEAAAAFTQGYSLKPHYAFLWNLALTYHALGDHTKTIEAYQSYLANSPASATTDRAAAQAAIATEQQSLAEPSPQPATEVSSNLGHATEGQSSTRPVWRKWWFWTATGAALAALGVGLGVGLAPTTTAPYREVTWR